MQLRRRLQLGLAAWAALLLALPVHAQTSADWAAYDEVFENGARQAQWWEAGWTGIYAASLAFDAYQSSEASDPDDRFDARVGVVKSALALGGMLTDRQPHQAALAEYERLKAQGELSGVQALGLQLAQAERERRGFEARVSSLVVNTVAGSVNFGTGRLINELQIWTQPHQASRAINRFQPARVSLGPMTFEGEYALIVSPQQLAATWRY